jgi:hypothetical protein
LPSWASRTRRASKHKGGSTKSVKAPSRKSRTIGRTYCNEIQLIETFVESESATDFKDFEALHNIVFDIDDRLLSLQCTNESWTNLWEITTIIWDVLAKHYQTYISCQACKIHGNRGKWLYMTCSNNKISTLIFVKKFAHNQDSYLNRCVLKREDYYIYLK